MRRSNLFHLSLLIILALSASAQANTKIEIDGPAPSGPRIIGGDKSAQGISNLEVVTFTGPATAVQGEDLAGLVTTVIRNSGPDPITDEFRIGVYFTDVPDEASGNRMGTLEIQGLSVGDTTIVFDHILAPLFNLGSDYFGVLVLDYNFNVEETLETDNTASFPLTVTETSRRTVYYEDFQGGPAGWSATDLTAQTDIFFSRIDYVDIHALTRGVWWCGADDPAWVDPQGYGNNWNQRLTKTFDLPAGIPCSLSYVIQYHSEPGYDFTRVEISNTDFVTYETLAQYDDSTLGEFQFISHDISDFAGQQVQIRFRFTSDGGWSDQDGQYLTDGAFRLDEVAVTGNPTDDFEIDGNGWVSSTAPPIGGEFRLEEDPYCPPGFVCDQYHTGTPGVFCNAWVAYDPATLNFPASDPSDHENGQSVRIVIDSPYIDISDAGPGASFALSYDVFVDLPLENGVFYTWSIRDDLNSSWRDDNFVYWSSINGWRQLRFNISPHVTPGASSIQIRLGANDMGWVFGNYSPTHGPTPYFDNVELIIFDDEPPAIIDPEPRVCGWTSGDTDGDGVLNPVDSCDGESSSFFDRDGDGCLDPVMSGRHIEYWDEGDFPLVYYIHEDGAPGITDGSDLAAIQAGFDAWSTIGAEISFTYGGTIDNGNANAIDQVNMVTFADPDYPFPTGVLAVGLSTSYLTPVWEGDGIRPGQIIDSDMIFNPAAEFRTDTTGSGTWIQSVGTHEAGHMLGLAHSAVQTSTMFYVLPPENQASQLAQEDIQAMFKAYPDAASVTGSNHLRGTVTDGYTGEPLAGAIVFAIEALPGDALGDTNGCDFTLPEDGSYHFLGLPEGDYFIGIHPLDGSSSIGFLRPGNVSQMMVTHAQTVFLPEFYNTGDSNIDPPDSRTPLSVGATGTTIANLITNVDQTPPAIINTSPQAAETDVAVNSAILVNFSEPMDSESFMNNFSCGPQGGEGILGNAALASDDQTLMFVPNDRLAFDTVYEVEILGEVRDLFENTMGDPVVWTFTTETQPPVFIDNLNPSRAIAGTPVLINGLGFDTGVLGNSVTFGGISALVVSATTDQILVVVPEGLDFGLVEVRVTDQSSEL